MSHRELQKSEPLSSQKDDGIGWHGEPHVKRLWSYYDPRPKILWVNGYIDEERWT